MPIGKKTNKQRTEDGQEAEKRKRQKKGKKKNISVTFCILTSVLSVGQPGVQYLPSCVSKLSVEELAIRKRRRKKNRRKWKKKNQGYLSRFKTSQSK